MFWSILMIELAICCNNFYLCSLGNSTAMDMHCPVNMIIARIESPHSQSYFWFYTRVMVSRIPWAFPFPQAGAMGATVRPPNAEQRLSSLNKLGRCEPSFLNIDQTQIPAKHESFQFDFYYSNNISITKVFQ